MGDEINFLSVNLAPIHAMPAGHETGVYSVTPFRFRISTRTDISAHDPHYYTIYNCTELSCDGIN